VKLDRTALPAILVVLIASSMALAGCSATGTTDTGTTDTGTTDTGTSTDGTTEESADTEGGATESWGECPAIVQRLNANPDDPTVYSQIDVSDFAVPEVGADVLAGACLVRVIVNDDAITWAILPGDAALKASIETTLKGAGFVNGGKSLFGAPATNRGVLLQAYGTGADLDAFLVYSSAFAPITEPIVYMGTFELN